MEPVVIGLQAEIAAMEAWARRDAEHQAERDSLIRAADRAGVNKRQIAIAMGISRTTVYAVLDTETEA